MARARFSTTVDRKLLDEARKARAGTTDAERIDEASEPVRSVRSRFG